MGKKSFWFDMQAPPDVQFFRPFIEKYFEFADIHVTARDFAETTDLLSKFDITHSVIGSQKSANTFDKIYHTILRSANLYRKIGNVDVSFALGNLHSLYVSRFKSKVSINFMDNELGLKKIDPNRSLVEFGVIKSQTLLADYIFVPSAFPVEALVEDGMEENCIHTFDGYKEDVYIANYKPKIDALKELPFENFVVIRPESSAIYKEKTPSLAPELIKALVSENLNVVFLPRTSKEIAIVKDIDNVFIPKRALDGLDLCYFSDAVLTGSGTLAREAACMGTPSVSFFPNDKLLAVDETMVRKKWVLHSRDCEEIVDYVIKSKKNTDISNLNRSKKVQDQVFSDLYKVLKINS